MSYCLTVGRKTLIEEMDKITQAAARRPVRALGGDNGS